MLMLKNT